MKKNKGFLKFILLLTIIMGALTVALLFVQAKQQQNNTYISVDPETLDLVQLSPPSDGDPIAIVNTSLGEFRFVLYPDKSPNAVKNFIDFAKSGYYDNTYVFNSESGAYSAAGSKLKNGEMPEGYDVDRELIPRELHQDLWPLKGAVCSLTTTVERSFKEKIFGGGNYYNGSRFAVLNTVVLDETQQQELLELSESKELGQAFIDHGGIPNFSQQLTVIGQTYQDLDVVEALANLETENNGIYMVPKDDVMIISVEISEYSSESEK